MAGSESPLRVKSGEIPNGSAVIVTVRRWKPNEPLVEEMPTPATVEGYIAGTDAYLCTLEGGRLRAFKSADVMRPVPKFKTREEADAWLESQ